MEPKKSTYWKFVGGFLALIVLAVGGLLAWKVYESRSGKQAVEDLAERLERAGDELYQKQLADTFGGATPQETLRLYIEAVEKEDYELASKYFIGDYQNLQLSILKNSSRAKLNAYIKFLKDPQDIVGAYYSRDYMPGGKEFIVDEPIYIRMRLYPSGIWKIIEI